MAQTGSTLQLKDPAAALDYGHNWGPWLEGGDTITASTWTVPVGLTNLTDSHDDTTTTVWLAGGTHGTDYKVTNTIVTAGGRTDERTLTIRVRNR